MKIHEPTADECESNAKVYEDDHKAGYAIWYPQMGGYIGKAVALMDKRWEDYEDSSAGGCVDVYVWHDGDFPFNEDDGSPAYVHHCDPEQFVEFGEKLTELNKRGRVVADNPS